MLGVRGFFRERKRVKQNWEDIRQKNQEALSQADPVYREYAECLKKELDAKKALYEAGAGGKEQLQDLMNLFEAFTRRSDFAEYQHVWVLHKELMYKKVKKAYGTFENVKIWLIEDEYPLKYYKVLSTAAYLFQGGVFPSRYLKRQGQFCLNIRRFKEGKNTGFELEKNQFKAARHLQNLLISDAVLVQDEAALRRLDTAFRLKEIYKGEVWIADTQIQAEQILHAVFEQQETVRRERFHAEKKRLLFYGTGMAMNGVTEALLALLDRIDYDTYDVTVYCWIQDKVYSRKNIERISPRARVLIVSGMDPMTEEEQLWIRYLKKYGLMGKEEQKLHKKCQYLLQRAVFRRFGNASFDFLIDFSGYGIWNPLLMLEMSAEKRLIWQHNDLKRDFEVENCGSLKRGGVLLEGLLSIYRRFDRIVSVNRPMMEVSLQKLSEPATEEKFRYVTNLININRLKENVSKAIADSDLLEINGRKYLVYDSEQTSVDGTVKMLPLEREDGQFLFVTMGRLSQEKNQENLILAFKEFLKEYPNSRLFIIGNGILLSELQGLALRNGIEKKVIFTGNLVNPYLLMKQCDCFVFPSYFEGQGLVVLEARFLSLPIVMSDYDAAESVCVENGQYLIGTEKEDILQGLFAYAHGEVPQDYKFDLTAYNKKALDEFYQVIED